MADIVVGIINTNGRGELPRHNFMAVRNDGRWRIHIRAHLGCGRDRSVLLGLNVNTDFDGALATWARRRIARPSALSVNAVIVGLLAHTAAIAVHDRIHHRAGEHTLRLQRSDDQH